MLVPHLFLTLLSLLSQFVLDLEMTSSPFAPSLIKTGGMLCSTEASLFSASSLSSFCSGTRSSPAWADKNKEQTHIFVCRWWALVRGVLLCRGIIHYVKCSWYGPALFNIIHREWLFCHSCTPQVCAVYAEVMLLRKSPTLRTKTSSDAMLLWILPTMTIWLCW